MDNYDRIEIIKKFLDCKTDNQLASKINSHQPNISRWKKDGFSSATTNLIDELISVIEKQNDVIEDYKDNIALNQYVPSIVSLDKRVKRLEESSIDLKKLSEKIDIIFEFVEQLY